MACKFDINALGPIKILRYIAVPFLTWPNIPMSCSSNSGYYITALAQGANRKDLFHRYMDSGWVVTTQ